MFIPPGVIEVAKLGSPRAAKPTPAAAEVTRKLRRDIGPISTHGVTGSKHYARYSGIELRFIEIQAGRDCDLDCDLYEF